MRSHDLTPPVTKADRRCLSPPAVACLPAECDRSRGLECGSMPVSPSTDERLNVLKPRLKYTSENHSKKACSWVRERGR